MKDALKSIAFRCILSLDDSNLTTELFSDECDNGLSRVVIECIILKTGEQGKNCKVEMKRDHNRDDG